MLIRCEGLLPHFLKDQSAHEGDIWNRNFIFESKKSYLVRSASGRGKSTLLGIIFGVRDKFQGEVFFDESNIKKYSLSEWSGLRCEKISLLFQELRLFENLTVRENMIVKIKTQSQFSISDSIGFLEQLEMDTFIDRPCKTLSFGQQQRVAIVRSLLQPFECLMMDEPFSHLDEGNTQRAMQLILSQCADQGASLIVSSLGSEHGHKFDLLYNL